MALHKPLRHQQGASRLRNNQGRTAAGNSVQNRILLSTPWDVGIPSSLIWSQRNGYFFASTNRGYAWTSPDGINWTHRIGLALGWGFSGPELIEDKFRNRWFVSESTSFGATDDLIGWNNQRPWNYSGTLPTTNTGTWPKFPLDSFTFSAWRSYTSDNSTKDINGTVRPSGVWTSANANNIPSPSWRGFNDAGRPIQGAFGGGKVNILAKCFRPTDGRLIVGGSFGWMAYSTDGGETFTWVNGLSGITGNAPGPWSAPAYDPSATWGIGVARLDAMFVGGTGWTGGTPGREDGFNTGDDPAAVTAAVWNPVSNLFVIGGTGGRIATSPDGITWTYKPALLNNADWKKFGPRNSLDNNPTFTLTGPIRPCADTGVRVLAVNPNNGVIVAVGNKGNMAYTSNNGDTWTYVPTIIENNVNNPSVGVATPGTPISLFFDGTEFIMTVQSQAPYIWKGSANGDNWTLIPDNLSNTPGWRVSDVPPMNGVNSRGIHVITCNYSGSGTTKATRYIAYGSDDRLAYSSDLVNWTVATSQLNNIGHKKGINDMVRVKNYFIYMVGDKGKLSSHNENGLVVYGGVSPPHLPLGNSAWTDTKDAYGITASNTTIMVVGESWNCATLDISAANFTPSPFGVFNFRANLAGTMGSGGSARSVAYGNVGGTNRFVVVGDGYGIASSDDGGVTWTSRRGGNVGPGYKKVIYDGSKFVAVGDAGEFSTSPNGVTWSDRATIAGWTGAVRAVAYDGNINNRFVAVGDDGQVATSPDGSTWTRNTGLSSNPEWSTLYPTRYYPDANSNANAIVWNNLNFVVGGNKGRMASSQDGLTWQVDKSFWENGPKQLEVANENDFNINPANGQRNRLPEMNISCLLFTQNRVMVACSFTNRNNSPTTTGTTY